MEVRFSELRAINGAGRVLAGLAVPYGVPAALPWGQEIIAPGAFDDSIAAISPERPVMLNRQHQRALTLARAPGGGLTVESVSDGVRIEAVLPDTADGRDTYELVRVGILTGLSVEFFCEDHEWQGEVRSITRAHLTAVGVVDQPAYPPAMAEARAAEVARHAPIDRRRRMFL